MKYAVVFPGQASQYVGMGRELAEKYPIVDETLDEADSVLGIPIKKLCFEGPEEELSKTYNTQPAIMAVSVAFWRLLKDMKPEIKPAFFAGHSLGEYTALVASSVLEFPDAIKLVRKRGEWMQEAVPLGVGAMGAVIGLPIEEVEKICLESAMGEILSCANINSPSQIVISGHKEAVKRALSLAKERGAKKVVELNVSAPFHCELMKEVGEKLWVEFQRISFRDAQIPIVTNVDGLPTVKGDEIKLKLKNQTFSPVKWVDSVVKMVEEGVEAFIEVGPGKVLSGLIKSINRNVKLLRVEDEKTLKETLDFLEGVI
ncbi:MAG: ACP S-malonyltransferase [Synergistetes bacterium]|nr:MAG: Malonyl CoA-acyl carrier protein transacylase [bacterium 42_11]MBC7332170.1 ACP S-malonyltransferase [Synergistota bacterium]MDK2871657.1 [acyl-carrier-protein] S-malonyltransferase [bacterium]